jgi:shikimate kinase
MQSRSTRPIALVGLMGAGKSSVARILTERLKRTCVALDAWVESSSGSSIAELFARDGEMEFRRWERRALESALESEAGVIDCGGGVVLDPANRASLRSRCRTVWLEVGAEEAARRLSAEVVPRPLLAGLPVRERLENLLVARDPLYAEVAEIRIATDGRTPAETAEAILAALVAERE